MKTLLTFLNYASWSTGRKFAFSLIVPVVLGPLVGLLFLILIGRDVASSAENGLLPLVVILASLVIAGLVWLPFNYYVLGQMSRLDAGVRRLAEGTFVQPIPMAARKDDLGRLSETMNLLGVQLQRDFQELEQRIAQRTRDLEASRDIGQVLSGIRDVQALSDEVIALLRTRFETIYHAQVFLIDERGAYAVLRASTGDIGKTLLARGHRLPVGGQSVIGQVTAQGTPVIALDTAKSDVHKVNELLPDTRSELALPLRVGNTIFGALDVQSKETSAFADAEIRLFQTIADQLAIAIQNAQLFEESQQRVSEIAELNRLLIGETWKDYIQLRRRKTPAIATRESEAVTILQQQAIQTGELAESTHDDQVQFAVPILLRGQVLGAVEWELPKSAYNENTRVLAAELATRLALSADNARLLEQSQRLLQRERLINDIGSKLTQQSDVSQILQTAVRELGNVLPVTQTTIRLTGDS